MSQPISSSNPLDELERYLSDPKVVEMFIDGYEKVYIEKNGKFEDVPSPFEDEDSLMDFIRGLAEPLGRSIDESTPIVDLLLSDRTRVNIVLPPVSIRGPVVTMRKQFHVGRLTTDVLLQFGSLSQDMLTFIENCVQGRRNLIVSGGTGSGKTTLLNIFTGMCDPDERIILTQHGGEMRIPERFHRLVMMETRPPNTQGEGAVSLQALVQNALRMRPDRIIVSELRGAETLELLAAMGTGHDGSMASLHANSPRDTLNRMEGMVTMTQPSLPVRNVRQNIANALHIIVQIERLQDGSRKVTRISEVTGMQGDQVEVRDIFEFRRTGWQDDRIQGVFVPTGYIPRALQDLRAAGVDIPVSLFTPQ